MKKCIKIIHKTEEYASIAFIALFMPVVIALFCMSISSSYYNADMFEEFLTFKKDSLLLNMVVLCAVWGAVLMIAKLPLNKVKQSMADVIAVLVGLASFIIGIYMIFASGACPQHDQLYLVEWAESLNNGDISGLFKGEYLAECDHQLGLVTVLRFIFKVFGRTDFRIYQFLNALMLPVIVFAGYKITGYLCDRDVACQMLYLMMAYFCVPVYFYVLFVYGEIISMAMLFLAGWMLVSLYEDFSVLRLLLLAFCSGFSVIVRQNSVIVIIAFLLVCLIKFIVKPETKRIMMFFAVLAGTVFFVFGTKMLYAPYTPNDSKPIPSSLYIAMGLHDNEDGPGWYDAYNYAIFMATDYDYELSDEMAWEDINKSLNGFKSDFRHAFEFFSKKIDMQWNAPMYQAVVMNSYFENELGIDTSGLPKGILRKIYYGDFSKYLEGFMNYYQLFVFSAMLPIFVVMWRKRHNIEYFALLIGVYGGFLFSLMWEAKPRYVFPYFVMLLPFAASSIIHFYLHFQEKAL